MKKTAKEPAAAARATLVGRIDPRVLSFTAGKDVELDRLLIDADCIGTAAHVRMLSRVPLRPPLIAAEDCERVVRALVAIMRSARQDRFAIEPADQDVHLAVERVLTRELGDLGKRVHTARSRNDQVAVDLRLYAKEGLLSIMESAAELAAALVAFGRRHRNIPMVGRTHLQPAMPSSVGLWATAHAESLLDDLVLLDGVFRLNDSCPLGSAAGFGVPLPIDRALTARLLGFAQPHHNVLYASNARGKCESAILSALAQVMLTLSRFSEDLILYTMPEFGYFTLPREYGTGSSIMPQKNNPDVLELVRARCARVQGFALEAAMIVKGLPSGYNRDLQEIKEPFLEGLRVAFECLEVLVPLVPLVRVHPEALKAGFSPGVFATDRALELVAAGVPFREAYDRVKASLDALEAADPDQAVGAKTHLGAPGGLDFDGLRERARAVRRSVAVTRRAFHGAISKLLGVDYPLAGAGE